jgi:hypothetical protein
MLTGPPGTLDRLLLWSPQTESVTASVTPGTLLAKAVRPGSQQHFDYRAPHGRGGLYYLEVKITAPGSGRYTLTFTKG